MLMIRSMPLRPEGPGCGLPAGHRSAICLLLLLLLPRLLAGEHWQAMPMVTQAALAAGASGGEGCQAPQIIAIDAVDGKFLLYGTDVGGMFRSIDGGKSFRPCNVGLETCGVTGFAIDPRNPRRCLCIGDGGQNEFNIYGGVHLSDDQAATWKLVLPRMCQGFDKGREQLAFDPASYAARLDRCLVAYWVEEHNAQEPGGRLYASEDGGLTWRERAKPEAYGGADGAHSQVKVHPVTGALVIANANGLWRSVDHGTTFHQLWKGPCRSLDCSPSAPVTFWSASGAALLCLDGGGDLVTTIPTSGMVEIASLKVDPQDARRMVACDRGHGGRRCFSTDGGATWSPSARDMRQSWIPDGILYDDKTQSHVWHPTQAGTVWGIGPGDIISASRDGGATMAWAGNGDNGIMLGGGFTFSVRDPAILYFGSQDYNGACTSDGGRTWSFINLSKDGPDGDPWGWVYGGYSPDGKLIFGGNRAFNQAQYELWITFDGGATTARKVERLSGLQVSYGDPRDASVLFCWNHRSADRGRAWAPMAGCQGVFTHHPTSLALLGGNGNDLVTSTDHGATWSVAQTMPDQVRDAAVGGDGRIWCVAGSALYRCDGGHALPVRVDQPNGAIGSVAVDPRHPRTIYGAGCTGTWRKSNQAVVRSRDGGATWESLVGRTDLGTDGGNCATWCRVHPTTGELWVGTCCYGWWRFVPER